MDSTGTSETYWTDNIDWEKEYAENMKWPPHLRLPRRRNSIRFQRVPDFTDPNFDWNDPAAYYTAGLQRYRERKIAQQEMKHLEREIAVCYQKHGVSHVQNCKHLTKEWLQRLRCPAYICNEKRFYEADPRPKFYYGDIVRGKYPPPQAPQ